MITKDDVFVADETEIQSAVVFMLLTHAMNSG